MKAISSFVTLFALFFYGTVVPAAISQPVDTARVHPARDMPPQGSRDGMFSGDEGMMPEDGMRGGRGLGPAGRGRQSSRVTDSAVYISVDTVAVVGKRFVSDKGDVGAVLCRAGVLTISRCNLMGEGDAASTDDASFYGVNAVLAAQPQPAGGEAVIFSFHNTIAGSGVGANGIFAYGRGKITTSGDCITQTGGNARGIMCSGGGTVVVSGDTVVTTGGSSSCIATDRGGGSITVNGGVYTCNGFNSAGIYSTGDITAKDATFVSNGGEMMVIEGSNHISVEDCHFTGNKDKWGVLLYQSFSGDASQGSDATLSMRGGTLSYKGKHGALFYNTNSADSLFLSGVAINNESDTLVGCLKGGWGNRATPRSGGRLAMLCEGQTLEGLIFADKFSTVKMELTEKSVLTGCVNPGNVAGRASLSLDGSSRWILTNHSHINGTIVLPSQPKKSGTLRNISGNGYNVFYNVAANPALGGLAYSLKGGGYLCPEP